MVSSHTLFQWNRLPVQECGFIDITLTSTRVAILGLQLGLMMNTRLIIQFEQMTKTEHLSREDA